jgi:hypothetical protein
MLVIKDLPNGGLMLIGSDTEPDELELRECRVYPIRRIEVVEDAVQQSDKYDHDQRSI